MAENDNSWLQEDDSWRKATAHDGMIGCQSIFFSVLSPQHSALVFLTLKP
jgi:hypothetical protein